VLEHSTTICMMPDVLTSKEISEKRVSRSSHVCLSCLRTAASMDPPMFASYCKTPSLYELRELDVKAHKVEVCPQALHAK